MEEPKKFRILSIDGGGIRGVFPITILAEIEANLKQDGAKHWQIYNHFDLIAGTSTGGIIALGLSLGIPAQEIKDLYLSHAKTIFGNPKCFFGWLIKSKYDRQDLTMLLKSTFATHFNNEQPRLKDCKTPVCIPIYDLLQGKFCVCKSPYHKDFIRDLHIPAYEVALATSAAPTYFDPHNSEYVDLNGHTQSFSNKVDGGVAANNPTLIAIIEAQEAFHQQLANLKVLSIGTGTQIFSDGEKRKNWGIHYWLLKDLKQRVIDLYAQGQSQNVENMVNLMCYGICEEHKDNPTFIYRRINKLLDNSMAIKMDETNSDKLKRLSELAHLEFTNQAADIMNIFFENR